MKIVVNEAPISSANRMKSFLSGCDLVGCALEQGLELVHHTVGGAEAIFHAAGIGDDDRIGILSAPGERGQCGELDGGPVAGIGIDRAREDAGRDDGRDRELNRLALVEDDEGVANGSVDLFGEVLVDRDVVAFERDRVAVEVTQPAESCGILLTEGGDARGRVVQACARVLDGEGLALEGGDGFDVGVIRELALPFLNGGERDDLLFERGGLFLRIPRDPLIGFAEGGIDLRRHRSGERVSGAEGGTHDEGREHQADND